MTFAFVFPGQGSQSVGMLAAFAQESPAVAATFAEASEALHYDLWQLISDGPEERLNATERTQPAMLAAGVATWRVWQEQGGAPPAVLAGHSLGEFTALVCAGALEFAPAVELVRFRGEIMQAAVPAGAGAMAAILGLDDAEVIAACAAAAQGQVVEPANFNSPGQVVIAGDTAAVSRAIEAAKARGAKRAVLLPVSVPAHSSLMLKAAERLRERLRGISVRAPQIRYLSAVDAAEHETPDDIRQLLVRQLSSPVRWSEALRALATPNVRQVLECGPGKVLTGLNKRIERREGLAFLALEDPATLAAALAATRGETHA
jgi:[acyl-carrier-protein] S-malonyltransferase